MPPTPDAILSLKIRDIAAGMNRANLVETKTGASPKQMNWFNHCADLERDG